MAKSATQYYRVEGTDAWINHKYYAEGSEVELTYEQYEKRKKTLVPVVAENFKENDSQKTEGDK